MHIVRMSLGGVPPFTDPIVLKFDEQVNIFIGPNASGKSTILMMMDDYFNKPERNSKRPVTQGRIHRRLNVYTDDEFDEVANERLYGDYPTNVLAASEDWVGTRYDFITQENPPAIYIGSVREGLPGVSDQKKLDAYGETAAEALSGPFSGTRTMCASELLGKELWDTERKDLPRYARVTLMDAVELADACCKRICNEVIQDAISRNYIPDPYSLSRLHHPHADPSKITILRLMGIHTTDVRNFDNLPFDEQPSVAAYSEYPEPLPIYLGHLSSGTEGTLLWIRLLALKMVHHYGFEEGWEKKPAILLIDEIENHLHPTWQRRVIPALLEHFPGLQIFATTHSPFVVAGLKAGQVHLLNRDANGRVTATTNTEDVIGWTADEILRTMMGVDEPTDLLTIERANQLKQLREKETLTPEETDKLNELRRQVNESLLSRNGPVEAQTERYADLMKRFLLSRQSDLAQDGG